MWLEKNMIGWCDTCNVPIIECGVCNKCGRQSRLMNLPFKGELRPILAQEQKFIKEKVRENLGPEAAETLLPQGVCFFNENSRIEKIGDIIVDGFRIFELGYDNHSHFWRIRPRQHAAELINPTKHQAVIKNCLALSFRKSSKINLPWLESYDAEIKEGDHIFLRSGTVVGIGAARCNIKRAKRYQQIFDVLSTGVNTPKPKQLRGSEPSIMVQANLKTLLEKEQEAQKCVKQLIAGGKTIAISFSGGKDSVVVLDLVYNIKPDIDVIFLDTGIEYPETLEYVKNIMKTRYPKANLILVKPEREFFEMWKELGPPSRYIRWCCKTQKFAPMNLLINTKYSDEVYAISGVRKSESNRRSNSSRISKNQWIPKQTLVYLIHDWTSLDVWLYSMWKGIEFNSLYAMGIQRTGCWACPMNSMGNFTLMKETHPQLMNKLANALNEWRGSQFNEEWVSSGEWRLRRSPFAEQQKSQERSLCGESIHKSVTASKAFSIQTLAEFLSVFGQCEINQALQLIKINTGSLSFGIFVSDAKREIRFILPNKGKEAQQFNRLVERQIKKAVNCVACGVCVGLCKNNALVIKNKKLVITDKCIHCTECVKRECPSLDIRYAAQPYVNVIVES